MSSMMCVQQLEDYAKKGLTDGVEKYYDSDDMYRKAMDKAQEQVMFCNNDPFCV